MEYDGLVDKLREFLTFIHLFHAHFKDGSALNKDGTWKHGNGKLTNEQKQYLKQNGWNVEQ